MSPRFSAEPAGMRLDSPGDIAYKRTRARRGRPQCPGSSVAQVAQLVEHMTENHGVGGSIPPLGTILNKQTNGLAKFGQAGFIHG